MPTLRTRVSAEILASFDEARGSMTKVLRHRATSQDALSVLLFVYDSVRREGRLAPIMERYQPAAAGLEFR